jgi:hypothetical protein
LSIVISDRREYYSQYICHRFVFLLGNLGIFFKKEELPIKLLDDPKIPIARRNPRRPHHSHKPLDVATAIGLKPGDLIVRGATTTT